MKSYVKLFGPPMSEGIKALRSVAIEFPEVCIMDTGIAAALEIPSSQAGTIDTMEGLKTFFGGEGVITEERCESIISKGGESLGEYDFYFEWFQKPTMAQIESLIIKIDEALAPLSVRYTLTTK